MSFIEVLRSKTTDNSGNRQPVIAFLGDSVTQGCFEVYWKDNKMQTVFDSLAGYPEKVKEILSLLYPKAPVSIVNAGIEGGSAPKGFDRLERDVLRFKPDLLVVCFGLNDSNNGVEGIPKYKYALKQIFAKAKEEGIETIFMTPNMLNTDCSTVSDGVVLKNLAEIFAERQNSGQFDAYMAAAKEACVEENVGLCDCYEHWKSMHACGVDTTRLLANGLNHPVREMHYLFAWQLVNTILKEGKEKNYEESKG